MLTKQIVDKDKINVITSILTMRSSQGQLKFPSVIQVHY